MRKKLVLLSVAGAALLVLGIPGAAQGNAYTYKNTDGQQGAWYNSSQIAAITGGSGIARVGGTVYLPTTFLIQTVSTVSSYRYGWAQAGGFSTISFGHVSAGSQAKSQCRWTSTHSSIQTAWASMTCRLYTNGTTPSAAALNVANDEPALDTTDAERAKTGSTETPVSDTPAAGDSLPSYVSADFRAQFTNGKATRLDSVGKASYWRTENIAGEVCIIATVDERGSYGSACTSPEIFEENGVGLAIGGDGNAADAYAYLLPSGTDNVETGSRVVDAGPQGLLVLTDTVGSTKVRGSDGRTLELADLTLQGQR